MKQGTELVDKAIKTTIINMLIYSRRQRKQEHEICNEKFHWMRLTADQALVEKGQ